MKRQYKLSRFFTLMLGAVLVLSSCVKDEPVLKSKVDPETTDQKKYVIAAVADNVTYLVTANSLDEGSISVKGQGTEVIGGTYWIYKGDNLVFGLTYNKGGAGTGASYYLNKDGKPTEKFEYTIKRITSFGFWGDNLITSSTGNSETTDADGNVAQAFLFNYLNTKDGSTKEGQMISENFLGNGEKTSLAGFVEANGKLYSSVVPMGMSKYGIKQWPSMVTDQELITKAAGGSGSGSYGEGEIPSTQYPDSAYVAIFSGTSFDSKPVIARTDKMGFACGRNRSQYYQTIGAADNGDLYVFSSGYGRTFKSTPELKKVTGTKPSAVMRIKKGETTFDESYYVNIESLGNKKALFKAWHISGDNFLLQMYDDEITKKGVTALSLAVYHAESKQLIPVQGLPNTDVISGFGNTPYTENGFAYMPVSVVDGNGRPALYKIDMKTGKAVKGLEVETNEIRGVGKLKIQQ